MSPRRKARPQSTSDAGVSRDPKPIQTPDNDFPEIDNAEGWHSVIVSLCNLFKLPDLTTRRGLKRVHSSFDSIYRKLEDFYQQHKDNDKIAGGIIGIYAKMCADSILRNKLFHRGFLDQLMPLLSKPETCHLALLSLTSVTHHGGTEIRTDIARKLGPTLIGLLKKFEDDSVAVELIIVNLAHTFVAIVGEVTGPRINKDILASFNLKKSLPLIIEITRKSRSACLIGHTFELLMAGTFREPEAFQAYTPSVDLLVAGLRSKDWSFRVACLATIIRMFNRTQEPDMADLNPMVYALQIQKGFPKAIQEQMNSYGNAKTDTMARFRASSKFQKAMYDTLQHRDLHKLGLILAPLITQTEYSVANGWFETGADTNAGLPFTLWGDSLPHCAKAIRAKGVPSEAELADILDIKYHIMKQRLDKAVPMAEQAIKRHPDCAYFYYAVSLSGDMKKGLPASKKGLKCKNITPWLRFQLTQRAVDHAGRQGIDKLSESWYDGDKQKQKEGISLLSSALKDAKTYVAEAPPDARNMKNVLYWVVVLTLAMQGPEVSPDLSTIEGDMKKLKLSEELATYIGTPPKRTLMCASQRTITSSYTRAWKEWGDLIEYRDSQMELMEDDSDTPKVTDKADEELASWLEDMTMESGEKEPATCCANPKIHFNDVELYACSHCGNPSAVLRKCSGCSQTRYCDQSCQKSHWPEHKKKCKTATKS